MKPLFFKTFYKLRNSIFILPSIKIWYNKFEFLETGVYSPALGVDFCWIIWGFEFTVQKGY